MKCINKLNCKTCSLVSYNRDCINRDITDGIDGLSAYQLTEAYMRDISRLQSHIAQVNTLLESVKNGEIDIENYVYNDN